MSSQIHIVLVEDEPSLAGLYKVGLQSLGEIVVASNKTEATSAFQRCIKERHLPDVVLLDLIIPAEPTRAVDFSSRAGFELLQWLRQKSEFATIPIIVMTNLDSPEDRADAEKLGATDYIVKSNTIPKEIVQRIKAVL